MLAVATALLLSSTGLAAPDLSVHREIGKYHVYPDFDKPERFYLAPGNLEIAVDENGRPKLHFLQMRYTGAALYGNEGEFGSHSTLTVGVRLEQPSSEEMRLLQKSARLLANLGRIEIRPLPITAFEAVLAYAPIGEGPSEITVVENGYFESDEDKKARTDQRSFWRERTFTIPMNAATSTLFWDLLQRQELAISINYAFFSKGVHSSELAQVDVQATEDRVERELMEDLRATGMPIAPNRPTGIAARLLRRLHAKATGTEDLLEAEESAPGPPLSTRAIRTGATAVRVDAARWPELFQRVDFNDEVPPAYAVVKIYCYDFANQRRPDLFYKKVEIEAVGVGGRPIPLSAKFLSSQRDLYARTLRFPVAVHVDRPFRYRVTSAARTGEMETGPWIERKTWGGILDITSASDEGPRGELEVEG
jgi:hypothetical protein